MLTLRGDWNGHVPFPALLSAGMTLFSAGLTLWAGVL